MKLKVQAQHLQPGDIVGSGEEVDSIIINSIHWPSSKVKVTLIKDTKIRATYWGKYTMINVERTSAISHADLEHVEGELEDRNRE